MINWDVFTGVLFEYIRSTNGWAFMPIDVWINIREFIKYGTVVKIYDTFFINYNNVDMSTSITFMVKYSADNVSVITFKFDALGFISDEKLSSISETTFINCAKKQNYGRHKITEFCDGCM